MSELTEVFRELTEMQRNNTVLHCIDIVDKYFEKQNKNSAMENAHKEIIKELNKFLDKQ